MANPQVVVDFVANTSNLAGGFRDAGDKAQGFGSKVKGLAMAGGAAGVAALTATLKVGVDELTQASKVAANTNAVLKSTGGVANVSAKQVGDLANALMLKSGIDDEAIQSGENLLLTFTNIRDEAGKGNDIFTQATSIMADMSVALGKDVPSSAKLLGKALNNPIKGLAALGKLGVTFTDSQKAQVKAMQESGDTMGAQKIILDELTERYKGQAEAAGKTLPGQMSILKESFANLAGELVGVMAPALATITEFFVKNPALTKAVVLGILALAAAMVALNVALAISTALAIPWIGTAALIAAGIAAIIVVAVLLAKNWDKVVGVLDRGFQTIKTAALNVFGWLKSNWPLLLAILAGPIGLAVGQLIRHWSQIRDAFVGAFQAISSTASSVISAVRTAITGLASWLTSFARGALSTAMDRVGAVFDTIAGGAREAYAAVQRNLNGMVTFIENLVGKVSHAASSVANAIKGPINAVIGAWNSIRFSIPSVKLPKIKLPGGKSIGGQTIGGTSIGVTPIPKLAQGAVIDTATLALVGEGQGREIVTPEKLLRDIVGERSISVRVFIGDRELTDLVRTEIVDHDTGIARALLAG